MFFSNKDLSCLLKRDHSRSEISTAKGEQPMVTSDNKSKMNY